MTDPHAGRERVLTDEQLVRVTFWVRDAADRLGLRDWRIRVSPFLAESGALAATHLRDEAAVAWIAVGSQWLTDDDAERAVTLTHELLHCHFQPLTRLAEQLLEHELGRRAEAIIDTALSVTEERTIDRLAAALAPLLPPFRLEPPPEVEPSVMRLDYREIASDEGGE